MAYIYKIENNINHKVYIGKTEHLNPLRRWAEHKCDMRNPSRNHRALYRAMNKYGVENFNFEILEKTDAPEEREIYYIEFFNSYHYGYNETLGGDGIKYLELPEQEICAFYLKNKNVTETSKHFGHDFLTIRKILNKNNIQVLSTSDIMKEKYSKAVAKIDKITDEILEVYPSVMEAERKNKCNSHIKDVCHGKRKTAGGFKWKFIE